MRDNTIALTFMEHHRLIAELTKRVDELQKIVIENHQHRLNLLDHCEGKPGPHHNIFGPLLEGTDVDHSSPQYQPDIHTEEAKVAT